MEISRPPLYAGIEGGCAWLFVGRCGVTLFDGWMGVDGWVGADEWVIVCGWMMVQVPLCR